MTPEAQRIAIAEACGKKDTCLSGRWKKLDIQYSSGIDSYECENCGYIDERSGMGTFTPHAKPIPDYLNDLNAMAEAEEHIGSQRRLYASNLQDVCGNYAVGVVTSYEDQLLRLFHLVHASAPQRAEAFLRTLGLWKAS